jgi:glycerophosphoryl diester phosphodiesterase
VNLTRDSCTAANTLPSEHRFIENTIPSIREAFRLGAHIVEFDIHPTADGHFVVFHDWTLECRTNGRGVTREQTLADLQQLDVGYGYTSDGGRSFPLRGEGIGAMPSLAEVIAEFPAGQFHINIKSNDPGEADLLLAYLDSLPDAQLPQLSFFGAARPMARLEELRPALRTASKAQMRRCAQNYVLQAWRGAAPSECGGTFVYVPYNIGWVLWGWPNRFLQRMEAIDTHVFITGPVHLEVQSVHGFDDPQRLNRLPRNWRGGVMTDRIDLIGPALATDPAQTPRQANGG